MTIELMKEIRQVDSQLRRLTPNQHDEQADLNRQKALLVVQTLQLRTPEFGILIGIYGKVEEELHPCSRNLIKLFFLDPNSHNIRYSTRTLLNSLRKSFDGDIRELIGTPDEYYEESPPDYISRTIYEINELGIHINDARNRVDLKTTSELNELKATLAERIVRLRNSGSIAINFLEGQRSLNDLIEVNYLVGKGLTKMGFHLIYSKAPVRFLRLITETGGYDREIRRK